MATVFTIGHPQAYSTGNETFLSLASYFYLFIVPHWEGGLKNGYSLGSGRNREGAGEVIYIKIIMRLMSGRQGENEAPFFTCRVMDSKPVGCVPVIYRLVNRMALDVKLELGEGCCASRRSCPQ